MQLSVVILNYNVRYFLQLCVCSVQQALQGIDAEIIVVDNNSSDDSCDMIKTHFPTVTLIENKENSGFPKGNNIGVAAAKGEYICILNPDTVVAEDTFTKVLAFAKEKANLGIVGVKLIDGRGNFLPESKRGIPYPFTAFTKITGLYKIFPGIFGKYYASHLSAEQTGKVEILVGAFMLMKRELYLEVGGFDEHCFMYSDDIDLSYTVLKKGKDNFYFHETSVIHYKGESTVKDEKYMKRFREAMNFFYKKHFGGSLLFSAFMKAGIVFFSFVKMFEGRKKLKSRPQSYYLLSENENLKEMIQAKLQVPICRIAYLSSAQTIAEKESACLIFDNSEMDFKSIIEAFELVKSDKIVFRILAQNTDYLIGSDSSVDRGEVILIC
ncbi:glycosyltransferase family 2 protein [Flavobacterium sp.]|uniref:glycosyltransferase family 2 protein n=1 Tax=Flavobacterium sp. TaxID=239 RepID=UPI00263827A8|nr:glycosyltransferase family 2 protein [Flavobacterium sp.]